MGWRVQVARDRLVAFIRVWPRRWLLLIRWLLWMDCPTPHHRLGRWLIGIPCLLADLTPLAWIAETAFLFLCRTCRQLDARERQIVSVVFGKGLDPGLVVIADRSSVARRVKASAFVTFHTIHATGPLSDGVFVHELVHCRQYVSMGSRYIPEALWAQRWGGGYEYGGTAELSRRLPAGGLGTFNAEQQAEIIEAWYLRYGVNALPPGAGDPLVACHRQMLEWPG